jgi:hydroxymethylbilane synthase
VRRQAQVLRARPDLEIVLLRGNVDTRLRKLDDGEMDAILLAYAGLKRLGVQDRATRVLSALEWLPSLGQGVIGIEIRETDTLAGEMLAILNHQPSQIAVLCERAFQAALDGSCRTPIAGLARASSGTLEFRGEVLAPDGSDAVATSASVALGGNPCATAETVGREQGLLLKPQAAKWLTL